MEGNTRVGLDLVFSIINMCNFSMVCVYVAKEYKNMTLKENKCHRMPNTTKSSSI